MELNEITPKPAPVELSFNVFNGKTGEQLNSNPLTEEQALTLTKQIHESDSAAPLVIRSNRAVLME